MCLNPFKECHFVTVHNAWQRIPGLHAVPPVLRGLVLRGVADTNKADSHALFDTVVCGSS